MDPRGPPAYRHLISQIAQRLHRWFHEYSFAPRWLPAPLRSPLVGCLMGAILAVIAVGGDLLILQFVPDFDMLGSLVILAVLLTALTWGAGPSLVTTVVGLVLLDFCDIPPTMTFIKQNPAMVADDLLFILVGVVSSAVAIVIQRARRNAEALAASLARERAHSDLERQRLQTVLDVLPVGVGIANGQGRLLEFNKAFRELWGEEAPLPSDVAGYSLYRGWWPDTGSPLAAEEWALARTLASGEVCPGAEVEIETFDGQRKAAINTAAPIRSEAGAIVGGVMAMLDISERKAAEQERVLLLEREQAARARAEKAAEHLSILQFISDTALKHLTLDDLMYALLKRVGETLAVENCVILLLDETGQALTMRAVYGLEPELAREVSIPLGRGVAGRIALTREPMIVPDLSAYETIYQYFRERFHSYVGVPLIVDGQVIGVMHLTSARPDRFTQEDARLLEVLASRIALAIDHARLYEAEQRAHADADARASQLEAIFEALSDGLMAFDAQGYIVRANAAARYFLGSGRDPPNFFARSLAEWSKLMLLRDEHGQPIPDDQIPVRRALRGESLTGGRSQELIVRKLDGEEVMINSSSAPVRDARGQIVGAVSAFRDVTERRLLERRTHEALNGLLAIAQTLVELPDEPSFAEERLAEANPLARRLIELVARVLGCQRLGAFTFDPEADALNLVAVTGLSPEIGELWKFADLSRYPDFSACLLEGKPYVWDMSKPPLRDQPNYYRTAFVLVVPTRLREHLVGALFVDYGSADHTYTAEERSLAEGAATLVALVLERERLLREREEARASALALREANKQMDEFLGVASHELRTPLTSVLLSLQLSERRYQRLLREDADVTDRLAQKLSFLFHQLVLTERQARRLDRLVSDLLDVSRIQANRLALKRHTADLAAIVVEVVEEQRQAAPGRGIHLHLPLDQRALLFVDAGRIAQVMTNYLTNAIKYSREEQPVEVGLEIAAGAARVWVKDQGPGLPLGEQPLVWERFHRAPGVEVQSGSGVGLGLGLHISRTIIEAHHGAVGVQSAPGAGATFWFTLPLRPPPPG